MEILTLGDESRVAWESFLAQYAADGLLQSYAWGDFRELMRHQVVRYGFFVQKRLVAIAQVQIETRWPEGRTGYLFRGPVFGDISPEQRDDMLHILIQLLRRQRLTRLIIEPLVEIGSPQRLGLTKIIPRQPHRSLVIDLAADDTVLLEQFKPKTRYNIRVAERKEVTISTHLNSQLIPDFLQILRETETRQGIRLYPDEYFKTLFDTFHVKSQALLLLAVDATQTPLATLLLILHHQTAYYLFGGTANAQRELMANYLLHFEAMRVARARGCLRYDFWGIASPEDPNYEKWAGITRFKQGFGGRELVYPDAYQFVYAPLRHRLAQLLLNGHLTLRRLFKR